MSEMKQTGAENVRWDFSLMYSSVEDPQLEADIEAWCAMAKAFHDAHKGTLAVTLGDAIRAQVAMGELSGKLGVYLLLAQSLNTGDTAVQSKSADVELRMSHASAEYLTFYDHELTDLDESVIATLAEKDEDVRRHLPSIKQARVFKPHLLLPAVESALVKRSPVGAGTWSEFYDEVEADLEMDWKGEKKRLTEMLHMLSESKDPEERAAVLATVHGVLGGYFHKFAARTLNTIVMAKAIDDRDRGFVKPMERKNKGNMIPDAVVDALHDAIRDHGAPLAQRYYRLKAKLLGLEKLKWSDRNAPLPFEDTIVVPWDEAMATVLAAYASFSPTLAELIREFAAKGRIDAPFMKGRRGGAFNCSAVFPGNEVVSYTFLNYLGSARDVATLAHEVGHGVHGILAGKARGPLQQQAPMPYAETASVFGEMTTFNHVRAKVAATGNKKALLAMLCGKLDDMMNTAVRQIGFSYFEQSVHDAKRRLSPEELDALWMKSLKTLYGEDGDVFTYENTERLWSYVHHFHSPFYVYAYAFGELFTQSLYAARERLGDTFEPLYLDMLRSGDTRNATELLAPFGLDPSSPTFWADGIKVSLGAMLEEAERLADEI